MGSNSTLAYLAARADRACATSRASLVNRLEEVYGELYDLREEYEAVVSLLADEGEPQDEIKTNEATIAGQAFRIAELEEDLKILAGGEPALAEALQTMHGVIRVAAEGAASAQKRAELAETLKKKYQDEAEYAREKCRVMSTRMLAWDEDRPAAATADEYRAKYQAVSKELAATKVAVAHALTVAGQDATRSKIARGVLRMFEVTMNVALRKALEGMKP
jgi:chromosome segregation ATPase